MIDQPTSLDAILRAKEERAWKQKELLSRHPLASLISLTINIPSLIKLSHEAVVVHEIAHQALLEMIENEGIELLRARVNNPLRERNLFLHVKQMQRHSKP